MKWHVVSPGLFYDCNESMVIYFDAASGDTHLITDFSAYLIKLIGDKGHPLSDEEIIDIITADYESTDLSALEQAVPHLLNELATLDIVARI